MCLQVNSLRGEWTYCIIAILLANSALWLNSHKGFLKMCISNVSKKYTGVYTTIKILNFSVQSVNNAILTYDNSSYNIQSSHTRIVHSNHHKALVATENVSVGLYVEIVSLKPIGLCAIVTPCLTFKHLHQTTHRRHND